jgi:hypothetical protein
MKFRKKPVVIEAIEWNGDFNLFDQWCYEVGVSNKCSIWSGAELHIPTLEGEMHAQPGDWIICGVKKELYPCKPDIFEQTYEKVED